MHRMKKLLIIFTLLILSASAAPAQTDEGDRRANAPVEPFRIIGNIYYVGAADITSFLIVTPKGHILLDGGFAETAPQIIENIKKLGFKVGDVKYLINSQSHFDHAGGLAELKRLTNAQMLASEADKIVLENGGKNDFHFGDTLPYDSVRVDKIVKNGDRLKLGGTTLKALLTPGHTKGNTTWTMTVKDDKRKYLVVFAGSTTVPGYKLKGNEKYPNIVADYEKTFRILKRLDADVFLSSHGVFFNLSEKAERLKKGASPNPFIDPEGYKKFIADTEKTFREKLAKG